MDDIRVRTQCDLYKLGPNILDAILTRQHEREAGLLLAVAQLATLGGGHSDGNRIAQAALAAHARLDAPPEQTLLEAATDYVQSRYNTDEIRGSAYAALVAAVKRTERAK